MSKKEEMDGVLIPRKLYDMFMSELYVFMSSHEEKAKSLLHEGLRICGGYHMERRKDIMLLRSMLGKCRSGRFIMKHDRWEARSDLAREDVR